VFAVHAQDMQDNSMSTQDSSVASDQSVWPNGYDDRWYIAPTVGGYYNDTDRNTNSRQVYYGLGVGRFISPNASIDFFIDRTSRDRDMGGNWANNNYGVAARFYAGDWNAWRPYALAGVMGSYHINGNDHGWAPAAELGVGLSKTINEDADFRV